jgi:hypothetical protein
MRRSREWPQIALVAQTSEVNRVPLLEGADDADSGSNHRSPHRHHPGIVAFALLPGFCSRQNARLVGFTLNAL